MLRVVVVRKEYEMCPLRVITLLTAWILFYNANEAHTSRFTNAFSLHGGRSSTSISSRKSYLFVNLDKGSRSIVVRPSFLDKRDRGPTTSLNSAWSNGQAIQEYQDFLSSGKQELDETPDGPSVIVTDGTNEALVTTLWRLGMGDDAVMMVGYEQGYPNLPPNDGSFGNPNSRTPGYPIYIAMSPSSLEPFLSNLSDEYRARYDDFVFFSGGPNCGVIENVLKQKGLCRDSMTQVLVGGLSMPTSYDDPISPSDLSIQTGIDSVGEAKYAGECVACGKWQGAIKERLERNQIRCRIGFYREWRRSMWEQAVYDATFNLIGAVRDEPTTHAQVANYYESEVSEMMWQLSAALRGMLAVTLMYGSEERLLEFAEQRGGNTPCLLPAGDMYYFTALQRFQEQCPMVAEYLAYAKQEKNLLQDVELPIQIQNGQVEFSGKMRKGNLRADGVV